jgi:hypothetical protein
LEFRVYAVRRGFCVITDRLKGGTPSKFTVPRLRGPGFTVTHTDADCNSDPDCHSMSESTARHHLLRPQMTTELVKSFSVVRSCMFGVRDET